MNIGLGNIFRAMLVDSIGLKESCYQIFSIIHSVDL